jgi:hypothetical protein
MLRAVAVLFFAFIAASAAIAQTTGFNHDAVSDAGVASAQAEIGAMPENELRALIGYFAECSDRQSRSDVVRQSCRSARIRYATEFGGSRAIDAAIEQLEKLSEAVRVFRGMSIDAKTDFIDSTDAKLRTAAGAALRVKRSR